MQVFCANLKEREIRKNHILSEFNDKPEFKLEMVEAIKHQYGAIGLWSTFRKIVEERVILDDGEFFIFCEDDHQFIEEFSFETLTNAIEKVKHMGGDLLLGGVSWFEVGVKCEKNIFWLNKFTGCQFMIVFSKFYQSLLRETIFTEHDALDHKLSTLTNNIFVMFPFISIQKEFGYSDVTNLNNTKGRVDSFFDRSSKKLQMLTKVNSYLKG